MTEKRICLFRDRPADWEKKERNARIGWFCGLGTVLFVVALFVFGYYGCFVLIYLHLLKTQFVKGIIYLCIGHFLLVMAFISYLRTCFSDPGYVDPKKCYVSEKKKTFLKRVDQIL